jgi:hypothetical protein
MSEMLHEPMEVQEPVLRKDRWWIYALIIFIIAVLMIGFYYYNNGWRASTGNSGKINLERGR